MELHDLRVAADFVLVGLGVDLDNDLPVAGGAEVLERGGVAVLVGVADGVLVGGKDLARGVGDADFRRVERVLAGLREVDVEFVGPNGARSAGPRRRTGRCK